MKKKIIRICALTIIMCLVLSTFAFASIESSAYIGYMNAYFNRSGNDVNIYFSVVGRHLMDEIGVSKIYLYEKTGNAWNLIYTFDSSDSAYTADMLNYNASAKADYVTYSGSSTKDYYALLYFYAADGNGSDTIHYYAYS